MNKTTPLLMIIIFMASTSCGQRTETPQTTDMQTDTSRDQRHDMVDQSAADMPTDIKSDIQPDLQIMPDLVDDIDPDTKQENKPPVPSAGCGQPTVYTPGQTAIEALMVDGRERTWRVRLPTGYQADTPAPVLFLIHGGLGSGQQMEENQVKFNPIADREGVIVIYPDGMPKFPNLQGFAKARTWNAGSCCGQANTDNVDDVKFLLQALKATESSACVDRRRVYSSGMSNGAMMSYRLACEATQYFAGIAPVAGSLIQKPCTPSRAIPLLHIHGLQDKNVPATGGNGCATASLSESVAVADVVTKWSTLNGCGDERQTLLKKDGVTCTAPAGCLDRVNVCLLDEGDHSWPGGEPKAFEAGGDCVGGKQIFTFNASEHIWSFLSAHALENVAP